MTSAPIPPASGTAWGTQPGPQWDVLVLTRLHLVFLLVPRFLPCDALQERRTVSVIVILSDCLSVCLSVTLVDCVQMVRPTIMISSAYGSPIILVSGDIKFIPKFEGDHHERGR